VANVVVASSGSATASAADTPQAETGVLVTLAPPTTPRWAGDWSIRDNAFRFVGGNGGLYYIYEGHVLRRAIVLGDGATDVVVTLGADGGVVVGGLATPTETSPQELAAWIAADLGLEKEATTAAVRAAFPEGVNLTDARDLLELQALLTRLTAAAAVEPKGATIATGPLEGRQAPEPGLGLALAAVAAALLRPRRRG
jgi:hypothetical protein